MKQTDEKGNPLTYWGGLEEQTKCYCGHTTTCDCIPEEEPKQDFPMQKLIDIMENDEELRPKQETLEEAAENYGWKIKTNIFSNPVKANELAESAKQDFIEGAKWQQEQDKNKYSEEDLDAFRKFMIQEQNFSKSCLDVFVEQFKNK